MIFMLIRLMIFGVVATARLVYWMLGAVVVLITAAVVAISSAHASRKRAQFNRNRQPGQGYWPMLLHRR
jgi:uncharacterized BrkB/YihY/UPF0761 family membrane protein